MSFVKKITPEQRQLYDLRYTVFTDGSCDNLKKGGWAAVIIDAKQHKTIVSGSCENTTNNQMELFAIIEALEWIINKYDAKLRQHVVISLFSDSTYCVDTIREWLADWEATDYQISPGVLRPNVELLRKLSELVKQCKITVSWVARNSCLNSKKADETCKQARIEA
jgi:ribonuclease HI